MVHLLLKKKTDQLTEQQYLSVMKHTLGNRPPQLFNIMKKNVYKVPTPNAVSYTHLRAHETG